MKSFIEKLKENNIEVLLRSNDLEIVSYRESISEEILQEIRTNKDSIVQFLKNNSSNHIFEDINGDIHYKASYSQIEIWAQCQDSRVSSAYHLPSIVYIDRLLDIETLRKALQFVINKYEILRTNFSLSATGDLIQIIHSEISIDVHEINYKNENEEKAQEFIKEDNFKPFDLEKDPLLRCYLIDLPNNQSLFYYNIHHIISDEWSGKIFENEIFVAYDAFLNKKENELENTNYRYRDYIDWHEKQLNEPHKHKQYWKDILSPLPDSLQLPMSRPYPSFKTYDSISARMFISEQETNMLNKQSQKLQGSLFTGILTVLKILIYKYTNNEDITIGSFMAVRERAEFDRQIGYFLKTLILRNTVSDKDSFSSLFGRIKKNLIPAYEHSIYPFSEILKDISFKRDQSRSSIFNIAITLHEERTDPNFTNEIYTNIIEEVESTCKYDIEIHFGVINNQLYIRVNYNTAVYEPHIIHSFMRHYRELILKFSEASDIPISEIDYLVDGERERLLQSFNNTETSYPEEKTLVGLFEEQVEKKPDNIAVVYEGTELTYAELNGVSNQLAHYLKDKYTIQGDDLICIHLPRSERMMISILGILKSGGAYVPIDIDYPQDRIDYIWEDTKAKVIIDEAFFSDFEKVKENYSTANPDYGTRPDNLAYIIYTSGTTGNPKGVMIENKGVINLIHAQSRQFQIDDKERVLQFSNYAFDASVEQIFIAFLNGAALYLISKAQLVDHNSLTEFLKENKITHFHAVPSVVREIKPDTEFSLKRVIAGGDVCSRELAEAWSSICSFYNEYGPTETTVTSIELLFNKESRFSIGKPISNTQIYILDNNDQLVPVGVVGELYIAGAGLARGYLNRPTLTEEKFISNPFVEGTKMYRTGDLGRWLPDGNIEYLGRIDHQVKIRGHRVELGEIESHVLSYGNLIRGVVAEIKDHEEDKNLVVYYVSDTPIDKQELSKYLETKLPQYMLPSFYVELESIPLTDNGKVDRKNLPEVSSKDLIKNEYVAPVTEQQRILVEVCEQVLKHTSISIKDNFYNLGGDSIKSIQIVSRLRQYGYSLKVMHILKYPVLEELSSRMTTDVAQINQSVVTGDSILTPIQSYFFEDEGIINKNHYNQSVVLKSKKRLSGLELEQSLKKLINHHDALRMIYNNVEGTWNQFNADASAKHYRFEYFDLRTTTSSEAEELESLQKIGEELQSTMDISSGILFHIGHVSMRDGDRLILILHHLVVDGVSWRILLEDLGNIYESEIKGQQYSLPSKTDSFQSWGKVLDEYSRSLELSKERLYWAGVESETYASFVTDYAVSGKHILDNSLSFSLSAESTKLLQTHAGRKYNAEINDILLTGLALALQDKFGVTRTKVLMEGHGRETMSTGLDISRTVGWFTSVYPFNLDISNDQQPALVNVKESLRSIPHKGIGYGILNYLDQSFIPTSAASVQFNYLGDFNDIGASGEKVSLFDYSSEDIGSPVSKENLATDIVLDVSGMTVNGVMNISIRFSDKIFKEDTVLTLLSSYQTHLEAMVVENEDSELMLTPSDLTYKGLSFNTISEISKEKEIEDMYELSPMQQGLYYHWLVDTKNSAYFIQTSYRVKSPNLDLSLVEKSFGILLNRYTILRTSFENRYGDVTLQIVHKKARVDFKHLILESELELDAIKKDDIDYGFNLGEPTQMRLLVVELPDGYYEFIWSNHHIIMDGWCLSILINDFTTILGGLQQGIEVSLPDPEKYSSYIQWLESVDKEEALAYWANYLQGVESPTLIPFVEADEELHSHYLTETLSVREGDFEAIETFCQDLGVTLNTYVQGAWSYLLSLYNGAEEVVFGSVVSGRPAEIRGIENMVGLFINTIPVHIKVNKEDTPRSLLEKVHQDSIQSTNYHFNSLAEIQSLSSLGKELINHVIVFENYAKNEKVDDKGNAEVSSETVLSSEKIDVFEQTNYPFTLMVIPENGCLHIEFRYDSAVFSSSSIQSLKTHFREVLHQFVDCNDLPLKSLDYVSKEEKAVLESFNNTETCYPSEETIVSLFESQVLKTPDNIAIKDIKINLTYRELSKKSDLIAKYLVSSLGEHNEPIGVLLDRSAELIVVLLGILKSGKSYIPIDPKLPKDRIDYIINHSEISCIITENTFEGKNYSARVLNHNNPIHYICKNELLHFESSQIEGLSNNFSPKPNDTAYIIYTSGSTGNPKGVEISHQSLTNFLTSIQAKNNIQANDVLYSVTTYSFDISILEFFTPLISGACVFIASKEKLDNVILLKEELEQINPTVIQATPSFYQMLLNADWKGNKGLKILCGGESLNKSLAQKLLINNKEVWNMYGPTETTVWSCVKRIIKPSDASNIGKPINNTKIYIVDNNFNIVPKNVVGRIFIGGDGLAKGYYKNEKLTQEKFICNPFLDTESSKIYETGDLGKWNEEGEIEFLGRDDFQVKIRGFRIELGEIETRVLEYSSIKQAVCEAKEMNGEKVLITYYTTDSEIDKAKIREYLQSVLPEYMVPSFFIELKSIPLTPSGKINRKALPIVTEENFIKNIYLSPRTTIEKVLVKICEEVLKHSPISILDNFYDLGGNSIKSIQIVSKLYQYGYTLKIEHILNYPSLEKLSCFIIKNTEDKLSLKKNVLARDAKQFLNDNKKKNWKYGDSVVISPNQYYFFKNSHSSVNFNINIEQFDEKNFENKLRMFISYFHFLKIKYEKKDSQVVQYYLSEKDVKIKIQTESTQLKSEEEIEFIGKEMMYAPYDLLEGELIRVFIVKSENNDVNKASLFWGMHHSLSDDHSAKQLKNTLDKYFNTQEGIIDDECHHFDFIDSQEKFLESDEGLMMRDLQIQEILKEQLYDNKKIDYQKFNVENVVVSPEDFRDLQNLSQKTGLPFNAFCLSVFLKIINDYNDKKKRFYGILSNNRENSEFEKMLGVLTNLILAQYSDFDVYSTPEILKNYVSMIEARTAQKIPYEVIRKEIQGIENKDIENNIIGIYNYLNQNVELKDFMDHTEEYKTITDFDGINFRVFEYSNGLLFQLSYPSSITKKINLNKYIQEFLNFVKAS